MTKKITADVDDKLSEDFRKIIYKKYGLNQGAIKKALIEAIQEWIVRNK